MCVDRFEEAMVPFDRSIQLRPNYPNAFFRRVDILVNIDRWDEGVSVLDQALGRFLNEGDYMEICTENIINYLLTRERGTETWRVRIGQLIETFAKHSTLPALAHGIVQNVPDVMSPMVSDAAAGAWRDMWRDMAEGREELELAVRLLDAAVRYRETKDQRVLLELPAEERAVLEESLQEAEAVEPKAGSSEE